MALVSDLIVSVGDKGSIRKINQHLLGTWCWVLGLGFLKIEKINTLIKPPYEVISSLSMKEELRLEMVSCSVQDHIVSQREYLDLSVDSKYMLLLCVLLPTTKMYRKPSNSQLYSLFLKLKYLWPDCWKGRKVKNFTAAFLSLFRHVCPKYNRMICKRGVMEKIKKLNNLPLTTWQHCCGQLVQFKIDTVPWSCPELKSVVYRRQIQRTAGTVCSVKINHSKSKGKNYLLSIPGTYWGENTLMSRRYDIDRKR